MEKEDFSTENIRVRTELINLIVDYIKEKHLTQVEAAKLFGVSQPRVSDLMRGKTSLFSVDILINILSKIGYQITIHFELTSVTDFTKTKSVSIV